MKLSCDINCAVDWNIRMTDARPRRSASLDENHEHRIARLESQIDVLKKAVRELADALHEELTAVDGRMNATEVQMEECVKVQTTHARAIKRQEERLKRGLTVMADALSALTMTDQPSRDPI